MDKQPVDDGIEKTSFHIKCHRKLIRNHLVDFAKQYWQRCVVTSVSVFGLLWLAIESLSYLLRFDFSGIRVAVWSASISLLASFLVCLWRYLCYCPSGIDPGDRESRRLAHLQPAKWESRLAKRLLEQVFSRHEQRHAGILSSREFVPPSVVIGNWDELKEWSDLRLAGFRRVLEVSQNVLIRDFLPLMMAVDDDGKADLDDILRAADSVDRLYSSIIEFERGAQAIVLPERMETLAPLFTDWSDPIRDGIRQLIDLLEQISNIDINSDEVQDLSFVIKMDSSKQMADCVSEMGRLDSLGHL